MAKIRVCWWKSPILTQKDSSALVSGVIKLKYDDGLPTKPTIIVPALETHSTTAIFTKNIQKTSKSLVSDGLNWADDLESLHSPSTAPTKQPRDLSGLRSSISSKNSFSSLQHCRRNRRHFNLEPQYHCHYTPVARNFVNNVSAMPIEPVCIIPITF